MSIITETFTIVDQEKQAIRLKITKALTGSEALELREKVEELLISDFETIYIDAKEVEEADLSGINEVIHSHYTLEKVSKKIIFIYLNNSSVEKWVNTTGLDKFVATAIVPAN